MASVCNPRTWKAEAGRLPQIGEIIGQLDQLQLHSETLSQNSNKKGRVPVSLGNMQYNNVLL